MTNTNVVPDEIVNEFDRLGISADQVLYSGLMSDYLPWLVDTQPNIITVKIYDDYTSGIYDGEKVLDKLKTIQSATVESDDDNNIWDLISEFEL